MDQLVQNLTTDPQNFATTFYRKEEDNLLSPYVSNVKPTKGGGKLVQGIAERFEIRYFPYNTTDPSITSVSGPRPFNQIRMDPFTNNVVQHHILQKYPILPLSAVSVTTEVLELPEYESPLLTVVTTEVYPKAPTSLGKLNSLRPYREIRTFREPKLVYADRDTDNSPLAYRNSTDPDDDPTGTVDGNEIVYSQEVMKVSFIESIVSQVYSALKLMQVEGFNHWYLIPDNIVLLTTGKIAISSLYWAGTTQDLSTGPTRLFAGYGIDFAIQKFNYSPDLQTYKLPDEWSFSRYQSYVRSGKPGPSTLDWYIFLLGWLQQPEIYPVFFASPSLLAKYWTPWWDESQEKLLKYRLYRQVERYQPVSIETTLGLLLGLSLRSNFVV